MSSYIIIITVIGFAALGMAWMPSISKKIRISYSLIYVLMGVLLYLLFGAFLPHPSPVTQSGVAMHLTELVVLVSLMGTGLKIDTPFSWRSWAVPFRLVSITMLLSIFGVMAGAMVFFHFDAASALLLGAALAPTDPVLASDVQVGPPMEKTRDNIKFSLTAEAGMNDGTAFPFTWLAIAFAVAQGAEISWTEWVLKDLIYRIAAGVAMGFLLGRAMAYLVFDVSEKKEFIIIKDGFVAIAITLLVYGLAEMVRGYGFIAVFVTAITMRNFEINHKYHRKLHDFTDQIERTLVAIVLILFGGALVTGLLNGLTWPMALFGVAFVFLIRPLTGLIGMLGAKLHFKEKMAISFFGIKGMGSFFYLAFALHQVHFQYKEELWAMVAFVVLLSIIIHGLTATSVMQKVEDQFTKPVIEKEAEAAS